MEDSERLDQLATAVEQLREEMVTLRESMKTPELPPNPPKEIPQCPFKDCQMFVAELPLQQQRPPRAFSIAESGPVMTDDEAAVGFLFFVIMLLLIFMILR